MELNCRKRYGNDNVVMSDIVRPSLALIGSGPFAYVDVLDINSIQSVVVQHRIDWIIHFSALLSSVGEQNVPRAIQVNIGGLHNILEVAQRNKLKIFIPSTIGAFGPESPRDQPTPGEQFLKFVLVLNCDFACRHVCTASKNNLRSF